MDRIESTISQEGIVTDVLSPMIEQALQCKIAHMHMITLSDISSFYATQLIQINLEPLWEVMKHIIFDMGPTFQVLGSGHLVLWNGEEVVFIVPSKDAFKEIFGGEDEDYIHYKQTLKRLKLLLTDHGIQFSEFVAHDANFFQSAQTLDSALNYIK